jgi:hypothetical protein
MTGQIKCTLPSHIILTLHDDRKIICPTSYCCFQQTTKGSDVFFHELTISVKESIDEITAMMSASYKLTKDFEIEYVDHNGNVTSSDNPLAIGRIKQ